MIARTEAKGGGAPLAINLELSHGRHGAAARIELHERQPERIAVLELRGWVDEVAVQRLTAVLDELAQRGATQLLIDCGQLRHIDYRLVPGLIDALTRFESHAGAFVFCGLSRYLRDLFRLAGCEPRLRCWPSASELLDAALEPCRESAS